eukprot:scaffold79729_cov53-Cyclotella_meneghiniana.AAC.1
MLEAYCGNHYTVSGTLCSSCVAHYIVMGRIAFAGTRGAHDLSTTTSFRGGTVSAAATPRTLGREHLEFESLRVVELAVSVLK